MRIGIYTVVTHRLDSCWLDCTQAADVRMAVHTGNAIPVWDHRILSHRIAVDPWRLDDALNAALALMPNDVDVCLRVDPTDRLNANWRAVIEQNWTSTTRSLRHPLRSPTKLHYDSRIHTRAGFRWSGPHTPRLVWRDAGECPIITTDDLIIEYAPFESLDALPRLEEVMRETQQDNEHRTFAYAVELLRRGYLQDGLAEVERFINLPGPNDMVAYLWREVAKADENNAAIHLNAAQSVHQSPSNYLALAEYCLRRGEWGQCYLSCQYALSLLRAAPQRVLPWTEDERLRGSTLHDLAATAALQLWDFEAAYGHAVEALRRAPGDALMAKQVADVRARIQAGATLDPTMQPSKPAVVIKISRPSESEAQPVMEQASD
jgi:tetratricopeptide (TPR) repeat protein